MGGAASRRKGLNWERWLAIQLRPIFPGARRQLEFHENDAKGTDLQGTGLFRFQCKKLKKYSPISAIKEIVYQHAAGEIPVLVTAGNNEPAVAVLPLEDFIWLLEGARGLWE